MVDLTGSSRPSVWHPGEQALQKSTGLSDQMIADRARVIRNFMPDQHRTFFAQLPLLVVGSVDASGAPWASLLAGEPGFVTSPDPTHLRVAARAMMGDPLAASLQIGTRLGLLGIELPTRRRNRMNGRIVERNDGGFTVAVDQSFGNCPKYIQARDYAEEVAPREIVVEPLSALDAEARRLIAGSDTFFVASYVADDYGRPAGVDISHRGGPTGFIRIEPDGTLTIPDFPGNRFFNTLGNLLVNPRAGLLFIDFARGDLLQVTGSTEVLRDDALRDTALAVDYPGAERFWRFKPGHGRWLRHALPMQLAFVDFSPASRAVGTWREQPKQERAGLAVAAH